MRSARDLSKGKGNLVAGLDTMAQGASICWSVPSGRVDQGILVKKACAPQVDTEK